MSAAASAPLPSPDLATQRRKAVVATLIGNFMEWFDFAVYGFVAITIGAVFFPSDDPTTQLLSSLGVFGVAFFFRPLGGAVFGYIGDRIGRRTSLALAITVMSVATALIGVLPGYATLGIAAPILLLVIRCIQGISVGGEWTGASVFLVEYAPSSRRGRWASLISATSAVGIVAGSSLVFLMTSVLSEESFLSWGWRVPFLLALPLGAAGLYMRLKLEDTPVHRELKRTHQVAESPFRSMRRADIWNIGLAFAFSSATGIGFYYFATYFNNFLTVSADFSRPAAILLSVLSLAVYAVLCPLAGAFSDRFGRKVTYVAGCFGHVVLVVPVFMLMDTGVFGAALLGMVIFAVSQSALNVMSSVTIVEVFPPKTRLTAGSIGYNLGVGPVAGTGPLVATALVATTGNALAPAYYLGAIMLVVGIILVKYLPETSRRSLLHDHGTETTAEPAPLHSPASPEGSQGNTAVPSA